MAVARRTLPDLSGLDNDALRALILAQQQELASRDTEIDNLKLLILKLKRMQFGRKSEKLDKQIEQLELRLEDLETIRPLVHLASRRAHGQQRGPSACCVDAVLNGGTRKDECAVFSSRRKPPKTQKASGHLSPRHRGAADRVETEIVRACHLLAKSPLIGHRRPDVTPVPVRFVTRARTTTGINLQLGTDDMIRVVLWDCAGARIEL
jgi:hypothetical protein